MAKQHAGAGQPVNLLSTQPDYIRWQRIDGTLDWSIWYGCPNADCHLLPVGAVFGVVYSPSRYVRNVGWRYVRFQVDMRDVRAGTKHATGKLSRVYVEQARRLLTENEVAYFEGLIAEVAQAA